MLYRGSQDGYKLEDLHNKIDGKGKTLVVIKSDTDKVFGGYTPIPWNINGGGKRSKGGSFLFSVRDDDSVVVLPHEFCFEVYHRDVWLLEFANSIKLKECCNISENNMAKLDVNYPPPNRFNAPIDQISYFLNHGKRNFNVRELEVFLVE